MSKAKREPTREQWEARLAYLKRIYMEASMGKSKSGKGKYGGKRGC